MRENNQDDKDPQAENPARKTLENWLKNCNLWCLDGEETGWQSNKQE